MRKLFAIAYSLGMSNAITSADLSRMDITRFQSLALANSYAARCKGHVVLLGCDERFWVVSLKNAAKLEKAGYEWA